MLNRCGVHLVIYQSYKCNLHLPAGCFYIPGALILLMLILLLDLGILSVDEMVQVVQMLVHLVVGQYIFVGIFLSVMMMMNLFLVQSFSVHRRLVIFVVSCTLNSSMVIVLS